MHNKGLSGECIIRMKYGSFTMAEVVNKKLAGFAWCFDRYTQENKLRAISDWRSYKSNSAARIKFTTLSNPGLLKEIICDSQLEICDINDHFLSAESLKYHIRDAAKNGALGYECRGIDKENRSFLVTHETIEEEIELYEISLQGHKNVFINGLLCYTGS